MDISPALPRPGAHAWPMDRLPDPEVAERPTRRRFTAAYKVAILDELDRATTPGSKGAILRREGLYSSHVTDWRRLRALGGLEALGRSRGPKAAHPLVAENERLRATVGRLEARLTRAEKVIAVQGNVSALLRELSLESAGPKDER
jgi:transposase